MIRCNRGPAQSGQQPSIQEKYQNYSLAFLPGLVADGLAEKLPGIMANNPKTPEIIGGNIILHVGSVILAFYKGARQGGGNLLKVQTFTGINKKAVGFGFYSTPDGLKVDVETVEDGYTRETYSILLPDTIAHPMHNMLAKLYFLMEKLYKSGVVRNDELLSEFTTALQK